jgi:hypothetical protein
LCYLSRLNKEEGGRRWIIRQFILTNKYKTPSSSSSSLKMQNSNSMEQGYGPGDIKEDEQHPWYVKYGLRALATAAGGCELFICNLFNNYIMLEKSIEGLEEF